MFSFSALMALESSGGLEKSCISSTEASRQKFASAFITSLRVRFALPALGLNNKLAMQLASVKLSIGNSKSKLVSN